MKIFIAFALFKLTVGWKNASHSSVCHFCGVVCLYSRRFNNKKHKFDQLEHSFLHAVDLLTKIQHDSLQTQCDLVSFSPSSVVTVENLIYLCIFSFSASITLNYFLLFIDFRICCSVCVLTSYMCVCGFRFLYLIWNSWKVIKNSIFKFSQNFFY